MTTYKEIFGKPIKTLTTDPSNAEAEGQIWYNSTSGSFKSVVVGAAWSSGSNMIVSSAYKIGAGTQTAALSIGGFTAPGPGVTANTEEYNGSGWSTGSNFNTARYLGGGFGIQTAAVYVGGQLPPTNQSNATEEYDGSTWTSVNNSPNYLFATRGSGTLTAGLSIAGSTSPDGNPAGAGPSNYTQEYDGTNWSSGGNYPLSTRAVCSVGPQTAAISGGAEPPASPNTLSAEYDGTAWTAGPSLATGGYGMGGSGGTGGAVFFGNNPASTLTQVWDGTVWATSPATMANPRTYSGDSNNGTNVAALAFGGGPSSPPFTNYTEEYNVSSSVITAAAWASGGVYPTNAYTITGAGTQTAAIAFGGRVYPGPNGPTNVSATYNGSSWTAAPNINTARYYAGSAKNGSQTAALMIAGYTNTETNVCEEYNGSSWTSVNNYPLSARLSDNGTGTQTAALAAGGYGGVPGTAYLVTTCTYDGTNWTALSSPSDLGDSRLGGTITGTQTAAIMFNGTSPGGGPTAVESWNGSTWTAQPGMITSRVAAGSAGTNTDALVFGGEGPPGLTATEGWDGTAFSTRPNLANGVYAHASCGTSSAALATAGIGPTSTATEEFTGETSALNFKTLTTS